MTDRYGHPRQTVFGRRHASAAATVSYSDTRQPHPPTSSTAQQSQQGPSAHPKSSSNAGVRRNLFQGQLTRRPTTGPGSNNSNEPGGAGRNAGDLDDMEVEEDESASSDIVVRDKNGEVELDEPPTLVVDDPDEIALDMRQENESELRAMMMMHYDVTFPVITGGIGWLIMSFITEERQRLADAVKHHQNIVNQNSVPAQPEGEFSSRCPLH